MSAEKVAPLAGRGRPYQTRDGETHLRRMNISNLGFTISQRLSRALLDAGAEGRKFRCEITEEGILFRPVTDDSDLDLPEVSWLTDDGES